MFSSSNSMTPADYAAISGNNGGMWGDGGGIWMWILVILCLFGGWGNGYGNSGVQDQYTLASDFATLQRQIDSTATNTQNMVINNADQLQRQVTQIANGISSLGYDQLAQMNGINSNIASSTYDIRNAIQNNTITDMQNTNTIGSQITALGNQMQSCCCDNRYQSATQAADLNYRLAEQSCQTRQSVADAASAITLNQDANTRSILDAIQAQTLAAKDDKIADLTAQVNALNLAASQQAQNNYIVSQLKSSPIPAYTVPNPYTGTYGYGACSCGT